MVDKESIVAVAEKALDDLREHGWTQGMLMNNDGRRCYYGALDQAVCTIARQMGEDIMTLDPAETVLMDDANHRRGIWRAGECLTGVIDWNDQPGRTQQEVEALLQEQIDHFKENGASA